MRLVPDALWAVMTLYGEARGEPYSGKVAVARVIRNRVATGWWGSDVVGVVLAPSQFSMWNPTEGNRLLAARVDDDDPVVQDCQRAWEESLTSDGGVGAALYYFNPAGVSHEPEWATPDRFVAQVGAHQFYRA